MARYRQVEFPAATAAAIIASGGKPVMALLWQNGKHTAFALVSDDPSGANGEIERHISVSASTEGVMRKPAHSELLYAAEAIGWEWPECVTKHGSNCIHIYRDNLYGDYLCRIRQESKSRKTGML